MTLSASGSMSLRETLCSARGRIRAVIQEWRAFKKRHYTRVGSATSGRLGYLDWGRGLCVVLMIVTHGFYGWVRPADHGHPVFGWVRLIGGFPGAVFLFISGLVLALAAESMHRRGETPAA